MLNFMHDIHELPEISDQTTTQVRPRFSLDASLFSRLLAVREQVRKGSQEVFINSITSSAKSIFSYVGESLMRILGEEDSSHGEHDFEVARSGGSYHRLHNAIGPVVMVTGMVGKIDRAWRKPQPPSVNGKRFPEQLITDEERKEWNMQKERFEQQRAVEVRALKLLAFRYAFDAARAYLEAEASGGDIGATLEAHGVPEGARESFEREVIERLKRMPPEVLAATFRDTA
jgi:hypothetical protein